MVEHMTRKQIASRCSRILTIRHGSMQYVFNLLGRAGYNSGIYGWNYDVFFVNDMDGRVYALVTGDRPIGEKIPPKLQAHLDYLDKTMSQYNREGYDYQKQRELTFTCLASLLSVYYGVGQVC